MAVNQTVYIKAEQNVEVQKREIRLNDIMTMECADNQILAKIKNAKLFEIPDGGKQRVVISILNIIERIHRECPYVEVRNLGVPDIIVTYEPETKKIKWVEHFVLPILFMQSM